ncbi:MAG: hypothetical protein O9331_16350, partial [Acidovorax sp.]|nr:hypothetical protein [Acidovorax sp.]
MNGNYSAAKNRPRQPFFCLGKVRSASSQKAPVSGVLGCHGPGGWYARCNFRPHRCSNAVGFDFNQGAMRWVFQKNQACWTTA